MKELIQQIEIFFMNLNDWWLVLFAMFMFLAFTARTVIDIYKKTKRL